MSGLTVYITIGIFYLLTAIDFPSILAVCPTGWVAWQDACYILLPDKMDWEQGRRVCDRPGTSMIVPDSQEEQDFIWREMRAWMERLGATGESGLQVWIGCRDPNSVLTCYGESQTSFPWNVNIRLSHDDQECLRMTEIYDGGWADYYCDAYFFVACEMRLPYRSYCSQADASGRLGGRCLLNHGIKNLTAVGGVLGCGEACWAEPRCHSFNLWQSDQGSMCQLNDATSLQAYVTDFRDCYFGDL